MKKSWRLALLLLPGLARADEAAPSLIRLEQYKPIYFVAGSPDAKAQLSFKTKIIRGTSLYFGYNQLMIWQIFEKSAPMRDINYNPALFYRFQQEAPHRWIDTGIEHESNGRDGAASRGWNRIYALYHSSLDMNKAFFWSVKAWVPIVYDKALKDLPKHRGVYELEATITELFGNADLTLRLYPGGKYYIDPSRGGQELTFRERPGTGFKPLLMLQLFHGYGENLLDYREERFAIRAGIGF